MIHSAVELGRSDDDRFSRLGLGQTNGNSLNFCLVLLKEFQDDFWGVIHLIQSFADQQCGSRDKAPSESALIADLELDKVATDNRHDTAPILPRAKSRNKVGRFIWPALKPSFYGQSLRLLPSLTEAAQ